MSEALSSASVTVKSTIDAATDAISSAISSDSQANPVDPITGADKNKVKSPTEEKLEGFFAHNRPDKKDLQDKGILKDDKVSPAIQAQREALKRAQLSDTLDSKMKDRPKPEELIKGGILNKDEDPTSPV